MISSSPGAPAGNFFWTANLAEAGHVIHDFEPLRLPAALLRPERRVALAEALVAATGTVRWERNSRRRRRVRARHRRCAQYAINPVVTEPFMMAITSQGPPAFPDLPDHAPGVAKARHTAATAEAAQDRVGVGAYVAESSYFQTDWQRAYWGLNYARLRDI